MFPLAAFTRWAAQRGLLLDVLLIAQLQLLDPDSSSLCPINFSMGTKIVESKRKREGKNREQAMIKKKN